MIISAVTTYNNNIPAIIPSNCKGGTTNPKPAAKGVKGNAMVITKDSTLSQINNLPGLLFNKDLCVRTTNNISNSVKIDSMNHEILQHWLYTICTKQKK